MDKRGVGRAHLKTEKFPILFLHVIHWQTHSKLRKCYHKLDFPTNSENNGWIPYITNAETELLVHGRSLHYAISSYVISILCYISYISNALFPIFLSFGQRDLSDCYKLPDLILCLRHRPSLLQQPDQIQKEHQLYPFGATPTAVDGMNSVAPYASTLQHGMVSNIQVRL